MRNEGKSNERYSNVHQDLIDGCLLRDRNAQFKIYRLYYKSMYNTSLRIVNNPMEAEDIMQESFLSAFEKIETYSGLVSFGAWLKRIVVNNSLDHLKKRKINFSPLEENEQIIQDEQESGSGYSAETDEKLIKYIRKAIEKLPDGYRIVLTLYLLEGYDHEEIGQVLGISSSTSRSQYTRARKKLLEILRMTEL